MTSFKATGLGPEILSAIADLGYEAPTPIQEKAIPLLLDSDTDLIALAQTGTGKTAAFGLPMLQRLDPKLNTIQALILCPTRELALQIVSDFENYSKNIEQLNVVAIYGGASADRQIAQLRKGAQVVVGTPGRTRDLIERKELNIQDISWLVLDEADEMLDRGFKHDLDAILSSTPREKRTLLFSATMPDHISEIARNYLHNPQQVSVDQINSGAENVSHEYYVVPPRERYRYLRQLLRETDDLYGIVFCRTKRKTREVARRLRRDGFSAGALEGDMPQNRRDKVMQRFRDHEINLLVATDVAARGVDVPNLTHVVNFNLPDEEAVYIHRSGRTGRAGKTGISIALLSEDEMEKIPPLEKLADKEFKSCTLETPPEAREFREEKENKSDKSDKETKNKARKKDDMNTEEQNEQEESSQKQDRNQRNNPRNKRERSDQDQDAQESRSKEGRGRNRQQENNEDDNGEDDNRARGGRNRKQQNDENDSSEDNNRARGGRNRKQQNDENDSGEDNNRGRNGRNRNSQDKETEPRDNNNRGRGHNRDEQNDDDDSRNNNRGRGRNREAKKDEGDSNNKNRGRGRNRNEQEDDDRQDRRRGRKPEAERKNDRGRGRNDRNGRDDNRRNNDDQHGEPLRRKTERAYDSIPIAVDPSDRRRKGKKKAATLSEIEAMINGVKNANPNQAHIRKLMPAIIDELDKFTWEEIIGKFVAYLDEEGLLQQSDTEEKEAEKPSGFKALIRSVIGR